jgi:hypothetical protein
VEHKVYLSRRNIQTLLNKLDRVKAGDFSACTLIKCDNQHAKYPQTMSECAVSAIEGNASLPGNENQIYLTREDLTGLLSGLDGPGNAADGKSGVGKLYQGVNVVVQVYALEDKEYYDTRLPGEVHHADDPWLKR